MRTLHFIYTVPRGTLFDRIWNRIAGYGLVSPRYRSGKLSDIPWSFPIRAPHSISYHLLKALGTKYRVKFYSIYEHGVCTTKSGDIVLAQPAPLLPATPPTGIDTKSITYRTFTEAKNITKIIIMPYSHDDGYTAWWKDLVRDHGKNCILISGDYWKNSWEKSPFRNLEIENILWLDPGPEDAEYPRVKTSYNPPGKRGVLYIGHVGWYKNVSMLSALARAMPDISFGHLGGGHVEGFKKIGDFASLTPEYVRRLGETYDIFINVSTGDPQVTTIPEMILSGFLVAATPESGRTAPHLTLLSANDVAANVAKINELEQLSLAEIERRVTENRVHVAEKYQWDRTAEDVLRFIERVA